MTAVLVLDADQTSSVAIICRPPKFDTSCM